MPALFFLGIGSLSAIVTKPKSAKQKYQKSLPCRQKGMLLSESGFTGF